jgi:hypothetical protein
MNRMKMRQTALIAAGVVAVAASALPAASVAQSQMPPEMQRQARAIIKLCKDDYRRLCQQVDPGGGRVLSCLEDHADQLTAICNQAMPQAEALKTKAMQAGVLPQ